MIETVLTTYSEKDLYDNISIINTSLLKKKEDRYYGYFSLRCNYIFDDMPPILGVYMNSKRPTILINKNTWWDYSIEVQEEMIKHEILHITFGHVSLKRYRGLTKHESDLLNIACDMEINQYLNKANLPENGIHLEDFAKRYPDIYWAPFAGSMYYYYLLKSIKEESIGGNSPGNYWKFEESLEGEVEDMVNDILTDIVQEMDKGDNSLLYGLVSKQLSSTYTPTITKTGISFKKYVKDNLNNGDKIDKILVRRPSLANKYSRLSVVNKEMQKILIAIDESGSVQDDELNDFISIITDICKSYSIELRPFDTTVGEPKKFNKNEHVRTFQGGTDLNCVLEYYNRRKDMTTLFVLTDGKFSIPKVKCNKNFVIFISRNGNTKSVTKLPHFKLDL